MTSKVSLSGYIIVADTDLDAVKEALVEHIRLTRAEDGCLSFKVTQCKDNKNRFDVAEIFRTQQDFDLHQQRVQNSAWGRVSKNVERHYKIEKL